MTTKEILSRLDRVQVSGDGWVARCPAHPDRNPSLSLREGRDGRTLIKCHAGCETEDVLEAVGLSTRDLFLDKTRIQRTRTRLEYVYTDADGIPTHRVGRYGDKKFFQERWEAGDGRYVKGLDGRAYPLYNLPTVLAAVASRRLVLVVEGERDCESAAQRGFVATTNSGGAGKWKPHHSESLRGADVVVIADNDEPGRRHAEQVAKNLLSVSASVRVITALPGVGPKGDLTDYFESGRTANDLLQLIDAEQHIQESRSQEDNATRNRAWKESWPKPLPMWGFQDPPALRWFVEGVLPEGFPTILAADGGTGKSYLALYLAGCVILGRPFFDLATTRGSVMFVDYELDGDEQRRRWLRVLRGLEMDQHAEGIAGRFHYLRPSRPLSTDEGHDQVLAAVAKYGCDLIILDSLTIAMQADASSSRDVVEVMGRIREWGTVLAIDHLSGASANANQSRARPFGSVFKRNIARSVLNLTRVDGGGRMLRATKTNFAEAADLVLFAQEFSADGQTLMFRGLDLSADEMIGSTDHLTAAEITLLAVQRCGMATAEQVVEWRANHDAPTVKPGTVANHFSTLRRRGLIELDGGTAYPAGAPVSGERVETPDGQGLVEEGPNPVTGRIPVRLDSGGSPRYYAPDSVSRSRSPGPRATVNREVGRGEEME